MTQNLRLVVLSLACWALSVLPAASQAAFPDAIGFGRFATGWRGGEIVQVTNLADNGPGSLRACAEDRSQPRVCVFSVSGTIEVNRPIRVASNTYIAGQTAPGRGIQIKLGRSQASPIMVRYAHNVLIRYLKIRPGPSAEPSSSVDGVTVVSSNAIYLDHLSVQFATDENVGVYTDRRSTRDITIANSVIAWGLDRSNHPKGKHSKGALICSSATKPAAPCGRISLIGNLFAHNRDRNPDLKATAVGPIEVLNNVFYNPKSQFGEIYNHIGDTRINYIGNVALVGPSTRNSRRPAAIQAFLANPEFVLEIHEADNINLYRRRCVGRKLLDVVDRKARVFLVDEPVAPLTITPHPAAETLERVLRTVGAQLPDGRFLDRLDAAVLNDVRNCTGSVIDTTDQIGGWPELPVERSGTDTDGDGMSDEWERNVPGLDPNDAGDAWTDHDGDGWSNLEEYLEAAAGHAVR